MTCQVLDDKCLGAMYKLIKLVQYYYMYVIHGKCLNIIMDNVKCIFGKIEDRG